LLDKPLTGRPSRLSDEQKAELKEIVSKSPEEEGFDTGTWTSSLVQQLIHTRFGEDFSLNNIQYILKKLGFSFKLPQKKTEEQPQQSSRNGWNINFPG
jgi:transposase